MYVCVCVCGGGGGGGRRERESVCVCRWIHCWVPPPVYLSHRANDHVRHFINIHLHFTLRLHDAGCPRAKPSSLLAAPEHSPHHWSAPNNYVSNMPTADGVSTHLNFASNVPVAGQMYTHSDSVLSPLLMMATAPLLLHGPPNQQCHLSSHSQATHMLVVF